MKERVTFVDDRITMALDVLVWLCDGQQKIMQDVLTTQSTFSVICNSVYAIYYLSHNRVLILLAKSLFYFLVSLKVLLRISMKLTLS